MVALRCFSLAEMQYLSKTVLCIHTVHGFEQLSYTTPESDILQGISFLPNVKGIGEAEIISIIVGTIDLEEDTASKFISHQILH